MSVHELKKKAHAERLQAARDAVAKISAEIYERRRSSELSLMARGIYADAARESQDLAKP